MNRLKIIIRIASFVSIVIIVLYLLLNLVFVLWNIIKPENLWGFLLFGIVSYGLFELIIFVFVLFTEFKENESSPYLRSKTRVFATITGLTLFFVISFAAYYYFPLKFYGVLHNRYKYVESAQNYINKGRFQKAVERSEKEFTKAARDTLVTSPIWFMQHFIDRTEGARIKTRSNFLYALSGHAFSLHATGINIGQAEVYNRQVVEYGKQFFPNKPELLIIPYTALIEINLLHKYDMVKANLYYDELSTVFDNLRKEDALHVVEMLYTFSTFYNMKHDFETALRFRLKALEIYKQSGLSRKKDEYFLTLCMMISFDYMMTGDLDLAENYLAKTKNHIKRYRRKYTYTNYLMTNALLFAYKKEFIKSEVFTQELQKRIRKSQGKNSLDYATILSFNALLQRNLGNFQVASDYFEEIFQIFNSFPETPLDDYYEIVFQSGINDFFLNNYETSKDKLFEFRKYNTDKINNLFMVLNAEERESYVAHISDKYKILNSALVAMKDTMLTGEIYNSILQSKSIALQSLQKLRRQLSSFEDERFLDRYEELQSQKEQLKIKSLSLYNDGTDLLIQQGKIRKEENQFFSDLLMSGIDIKQFYLDTYTWQDVLTSLKEGEAAIEIICLPEHPAINLKDNYYALILSPDFKSPQLINLFCEDEIKELLVVSGTTPSRINQIYNRESALILKELILSPIFKMLPATNKIYLSVGGLLNEVSFIALTIDDEVDIHLVNSTRIVAERGHPVERRLANKSVLYGDINYELSNSSPNSEGSIQDLYLGNELIESILRAGFERLPNTRREISEIAHILNMNGFEVDTITGSSATEESFREVTLNPPKILHVATHGFYFPVDQTYQLEELFPGMNFRSGTQSILLRSGLLFAGANNIGSSDFKNDGILTSYEISSLDFTNTELVVLSACETGLGEVRGSEGVFGLQRAFKMAGAKSLILSLWKVPDKQTSDLFQTFYEYYLFGMSKHEALKNAQRKVRETNPDPFFWAAFQLIE